MKERFSRRSILTIAGVGTVSLAGCLRDSESSAPNTNNDADADDVGSDEGVADDVGGDEGVADDVGGDEGDGDDADVEEEDPDDVEEPSDWEVKGSPLDASFDATVAVENLEKPWELAFAPNGDVFLTERSGRIRRGNVEDLTGDEPTDGTELAEESVVLPNLAPGGETGILGLTLHPSYPDPAYVYVFYTADEGGLIDRVVRYDATDVGEVKIVVDDLPGAVHHNGGRLAFGPDDHLWISRGDARLSDPGAAQDPGSLVGSILRVTEDGEPAGSGEAPDNADPRVFSFGHRNVQGLDWMPDGMPITTEHGPTARDEVNLLTPGANYGWPIARGGPDDPDYEAYDGETFSPPVASSGTDETWAPSGGTWYDHETFPELQHRFLFAGLRSQRIHVLTLLDSADSPPEDATVVHDEPWLDDRYLAVRHELLVEEFGRIRHVVSGPDGEIYFLTSNGDDVIGRLDPV